jgi:hypothetical protein
MEAIVHLENINADAAKLLDMTAREVGSLCHNQKAGQRMLDHVKMLPHLSVETFVQPLTRGVLRMSLSLFVDFQWSERYHGTAEPFWVWVEDGENEFIYHHEYVLISRKQAGAEHKLEFVIPVRDPMPPQYYVR